MATSIKWAWNIFSEWVAHSIGMGQEFKPEDLLLTKDANSLSTMLSTFCLEVKQRSGDPYTPKSSLQILTNLQNYA